MKKSIYGSKLFLYIVLRLMRAEYQARLPLNLLKEYPVKEHFNNTLFFKCSFFVGSFNFSEMFSFLRFYFVFVYSFVTSGEDKCLEKNLEAKATIVAQGNGKINTCMTLSKSNKTHASTLSGNGLETLAEEPLNVVTTPTTTTNGGTNEINFKFPIDDRVCTIDDLIIVPPAPPPPVKSVSLTQQGSEFTNIRNSSNSNSISNSNNLGLMYSTTPRNCGNTTARAAVAAAATLIPPGAPSDIGTPNSLTTAPLTPARSPLPPEAIVMVLPSPTALIEQQQQQQQTHPTQQHQRQPQQHLLHLTTLEPLVSVN